jgi:outer membrane cobalamin receptor
VKWTLLVAALAQTSGARAQDTLRPRLLDPVVATAERTRGSVSSSMAAVTRLAAEELARYPRATLADLLRLAPGFSTVDFDGLGFDPQLMVRGFYGGGEAEYVIVQVDGHPVNQLQTGLVAWDVLPPLAAIEAIEVVRGGASSLYGDAAIGGIINIITRRSELGRQAARLSWEGSGGSFGTWSAAAGLAGRAGRQSLSLAGGVDRTQGFRDHAERTAARANAGMTLTEGSSGWVGVAVRSHWRDNDDPGPLRESLLQQDRSGSDPLFRFDHSSDKGGVLALQGSRSLAGRTQLVGSASAELRRVDAIRTLALAPGFGDTKERLAGTDRGALSLQLESGDAPLPHTDRLIVGIEAARGGLNSRYFRFSDGERGPLDTQGSSTRTSGAIYAELLGRPFDALRLTLGARLDLLDDSFEPRIPSGQARESASHTAFSPKAGLNLRYLNRATSAGNLYLAIGRSFKAATLDQLYDQRSIPIPFPPFAVTTSNPELRPQSGSSVELGAYQSAELARGVRATASLSSYQMNMKDELDFDITSFRYVNLGRSRHRGIEAGLHVGGSGASGFANYTLQSAISRSGNYSGQRLKAIPRHSVTAGLSLRPGSLLEATMVATHVHDIFLDDANSVRLPNYSRVDAQLVLRVRGIGVLLSVRNLLGSEYSTTGFLDPSGSGEAYLYPAAGQVIVLGVRGGW